MAVFFIEAQFYSYISNMHLNLTFEYILMKFYNQKFVWKTKSISFTDMVQ